MSISLTSAALERVKSFIGKQAGAVGFRVAVKKTGCSGWAYEVDLTDSLNDDDVVFDQQGVPIVVDPKALELIDGTEIDFVVDGLNRSFKFNNPKMAGECGCGESFTV